MSDKDKIIRKRVTYQKFEKLYDELKGKPIDEQMMSIFKLLDSMMAFNSHTSSVYAKESMELLLKDKKETV